MHIKQNQKQKNKKTNKKPKNKILVPENPPKGHKKVTHKPRFLAAF